MRDRARPLVAAGLSGARKHAAGPWLDVYTSGLEEPTIKRLEAQDGPLAGRTGTGEKIEAALERAGIELMTTEVVPASGSASEFTSTQGK
jgi:hypothetical protein